MIRSYLSLICKILFLFFYHDLRFCLEKILYYLHYQLSCSNEPIVLSKICRYYITNWTRPFMSYVFSPKTYMYFYKHNMSILLQATKFTITYLPFYGPEEHIPGRNSVDQLIEQANISSQMFSFSKVRCSNHNHRASKVTS